MQFKNSNTFRASAVSDGVIIALQDDSNGAVWINDGGESRKVEIPSVYEMPKFC